MPGMSNVHKTNVINHFHRNASVASPVNQYLSLWTSAPGDDESGTEVSGPGYARILITFDADTLGVTQNSALVTMAAASGAWGIVTHWAIHTALSGTGNKQIWGALDNSHTIDTPDVPKVAAGGLVLTYD